MKTIIFCKQLVALMIIGVMLLVLVACSPAPATTTVPTLNPTQTPTPTATPAPGPAIAIDLVAQGMAFDKGTLTVSAGASVTLNFNNKDSGIPHNFALYTNSSATTQIFVGQTITGPSTTTYTFAAPSTAGTYFFRCDVHPATMTGSFIVTAV